MFPREMAMPSNRTPMTQVRFTPQDKLRIAVIRERYGFPTEAAALRFAVNLAFQAEWVKAQEPPAKGPRKRTRPG